MADEDTATIRELLGSARKLSKQASDLWETAYRTDDEDAAQGMSDRAAEIEAKAQAIRDEYTELTGIHFNSDGEPDPYVVGDDGLKAGDPSTLASAGLDPTLMTKAEQQDAHTELAAAERAERAEQVEQAGKDYIAEVLDVDTTGMSDDQLRDLVAKNQGAFDLDYARETGELKLIEEALGVDVSDLTFDEVTALVEANKQKLDQFDARQMGVADMDIDPDAFSPDEVARLEEIKASVGTELDLNVPEGLEGKIVRIDADGAAIDPAARSSSPDPADGLGPGDSDSAGDRASAAEAAARDGSPTSPIDIETDRGAGDLGRGASETPDDVGSSVSSPSTDPDEGTKAGTDTSSGADAAAPASPAPPASPAGPARPASDGDATDTAGSSGAGEQGVIVSQETESGTDEVVDIVLTVSGVAGDIDFHMSSDGRWFDEAGHEVTDPQRLHLDDLFESFTAQGGWPTDGTVSELDVSDTTFEEFVTEVADAMATDADGSDTSAGDPDPATSGSDGGDPGEDEAEGNDTSGADGADDRDASDDTGDTSGGDDGSGDHSADDSDSSDDDTTDDGDDGGGDGDDGSTDGADAGTDGDGSTDAEDAEDTAEDRGPEGEAVRDVADTLNDPSFQIRVEAGRTGDVTPDPMASGLDSPSTPPITQSAGAPGPDVVVNPGEDELLVREADVEARLASSSYGQGAIDYGDEGPPDLPDEEGGPTPGNPDPVTADIVDHGDGAEVFASATEAVDVQLDAGLDAGLDVTSGFEVAAQDAGATADDDIADE